MRLSFLQPRVDRLGANNEFQRIAEAGLLGRLRAPVLLLGRDVCSYAHFSAPQLPRSSRRRAASMFALSNSPYVEGGSLVLATGRGLGVWWWDLSRSADAIARQYGRTRPTVRPETLALSPGDGWRILAIAGGYEAQLWRAGELKASVWRKGRFDERAWADLTRVHSGDEATSARPPSPTSLPFDVQSATLGLDQVQVTREQGMIMAVTALATATLSLTLYLTGMTLNLNARTEGVAQQTNEVIQSIPATEGRGQGRREDARLTAFQTVARSTSPLTAAGAAIGAAAIHDLTPLTLDASLDTLIMTLPGSGADQVEELVAELEGSGYFSDIRPRIEPGTGNLRVEMTVIAGQSPLEGIE